MEQYIPQTEAELAQWMKDNCYNFNHYSIGGNLIHEGCGIDTSGGLYIWYYQERGDKRNLEYFDSEAQIVQYAFEQIKADEWAKLHCVGFTTDQEKSKSLANILKERGLELKEDQIPYFGPNKPVYRTYVFGCDHLKCQDLKEAYFEKY